MAHFSDPTPAGAQPRPESTQIADLADARAALRRDRERVAPDRAEADRLLLAAQGVHAEAVRRRDRTKRLAYRYARRVRQKWAAARAELHAARAAQDEARGQFTAEVARFEIARSDFHVAAAEERERLREGWAALESQRRRAAGEWTETTEYFTKQETALVARAADLAGRERAVIADRKKLEGEAAGLRAEAAGLEARVANTREVAGELERTRDRLRAELLGSLAPPDREVPAELRVALDRRADRDLTGWADELDARDKLLTKEKAAVAAVKAALDRENADLGDRRRVLAEQFTLLATARGQWQDAERRTVGEMEDLARGLGERERDLDARGERLARADARRREDAYEAWQFRLRLEAWQSKLTLVEQQWHAERERRDAAHARRVAKLTRREAEVEAVVARQERARDGERARLGAELRLWSEARSRMADAADEYDRRSREVLTELVTHAARALASEELVAGADSGRARRRFEVMRKRWEGVFRRKLGEIDARRAAAAADHARLDDRYREWQRFLADVVEREASGNTLAGRADAAAVAGWTAFDAGGEPQPERVERPATPAELAVLRAEFERMAAVLIDAAAPEPPDADLPWADDEIIDAAPEPAEVFRFEARQAA